MWIFTLIRATKWLGLLLEKGLEPAPIFVNLDAFPYLRNWMDCAQSLHLSGYSLHLEGNILSMEGPAGCIYRVVIPTVSTTLGHMAFEWEREILQLIKELQEVQPPKERRRLSRKEAEVETRKITIVFLLSRYVKLT